MQAYVGRTRSTPRMNAEVNQHKIVSRFFNRVFKCKYENAGLEAFPVRVFTKYKQSTLVSVRLPPEHWNRTGVERGVGEEP
jgi:hypothetical protein